MYELGYLSKYYESNGNPGCISNGFLDPGGASYGAFQFSSHYGTVHDFIDWVSIYADDSPIKEQLLLHTPLSPAFDAMWQHLGLVEEDCFYQLQHDYVEARYFVPASELLRKAYFTIEHHSHTMSDVIWSRTVQYGVGNIVELFIEASIYLGYPNLSYVDDVRFDGSMIEAIYTVCCTEEWATGPLRPALVCRFHQECKDALQALHEETLTYRD